MAVFTIELYKVLELKPADVTEAEWIGLSDYPLTMESWRDTLNRDIMDAYNGREIGQESIDKFRFAMRRKMRLIMPYYDALYMSTKLQFDPLSTVNLKTVTTGESTDNSKGTSKGDSTTNSGSESRSVQYATPQNALGQQKDYATGAGDSFSKGNGTGTSNEENEAEARSESLGESETTGYQGAPAALVVAYRQALINVNEMVINDLSDLFMGVWDNGDSFAKGRY